MPSLHVLHVSHAVNTGLAHCVADYVSHQAEHGVRVTVACPGGTLGRLASERGARVVEWKARRQPGIGVLAEALRLRRILAEERPDVVHLHCAKAGMVGRLVLRGRTPTVFMPHAWSFFAVSGFMRRAVLTWERWATRWTSATICVSQAEHDSGVAHGIRGRLEVLPNEISASSMDHVIAEPRREAREALGIDPAAPLAVCSARLVRQKGQDILVGVWDAVRARVPDAQLVLIGDGGQRASLEESAGDGVRFLGAADRSVALRWMHAADLVVCPSRWEGMSLVPLEAMALGRPMVVTDVTGMAEVIPAGAARVVPPEDPAALALAVTEMLSDPDTAEQAGVLGRTHAVTTSADHRSAARMLEVYVSLCTLSSARGLESVHNEGC